MNSESYDAQESPISIDFGQYLLLAWHWLWLIILVGVVAGAMTYYYNKKQMPIYQASTTLLISDPNSSTSNGLMSSSIVSGYNMGTTYSQMITDLPVLQEVVDKLKINVNPAGLKGMISVQIIKDTQLLEVSVIDYDPQRAVDIANTLGTVFSDRIHTLQASRYSLSEQNLQDQLTLMDQQLQQVADQLAVTTDLVEKDRLETMQAQYRQIYSVLVSSFEQVHLAEAQTDITIVQVEPATLPYSPISPRTQQNTMVAVFTSMLITLGVIFGINLLDDTVTNPDELARVLKLPILGVIPHQEGQVELPITQMQPRSPISEAYRILRTNVEYTNADHNLHILLVTSPLPSDGKTTVVANLAVTMAQRGLHTVLIDGDMRRPHVHRTMGLPNRTGLSSLFLQHELSFDGNVQNTMLKDLKVISSGPLPPNPAELLGSKRMSEILVKTMEQNDMVLLDTPPSLTVADATVLAPLVDGIIIVVKAGKTKTNAVKRQVNALRQVGARLIGIVINDVKMTRSRYSYYYNSYYYHSYYGTTDKPHNGKRKNTKNSAPAEEIQEEKR